MKKRNKDIKSIIKDQILGKKETFYNQEKLNVIVDIIEDSFF